MEVQNVCKTMGHRSQVEESWEKATEPRVASSERELKLLLTLKSINPFLSRSNVRKTWSQNSSAFPLGKNILYMSTNLAGVRRPLGQSCYRVIIIINTYKYRIHIQIEIKINNPSS